MLYRGYSASPFGALTDEFIDLMSDVTPDWLGLRFIDVSERGGRAELEEKMADVPDGARVVLSYRAQVVLLGLMAEEQGYLDQLWDIAASLPASEGAQMRSAIDTMQRDLDGRLVALVRANQDAAGKGLPPAEEFMAETTGTSRTLTGLEIAGLVLGGVIVIALIVTAGVVIHKAIKGVTDKASALLAVDKFIAEGRPDLATQIFQQAQAEKPFPWGWLLGVGAAVTLAGVGFAYYQGYFGKLGERLGAGD